MHVFNFLVTFLLLITNTALYVIHVGNELHVPNISRVFFTLSLALKVLIDPLGGPTITAGSYNCFYTSCPYVHPHFIAKQNKIQVKTMHTTGEGLGLAEWIIDDTFFFAKPT